MSELVKIILVFLRAYWRESIIAAMTVFILGSNKLYYSPKIRNLTVEVREHKVKLAAIQSAFDHQSNTILQEVKRTNEITEIAMENLNSTLDSLGREESAILDAIMNISFPEMEGCEDINEYMINMVKYLGVSSDE